jgi:beta-lactamase regulating signal transducer with metallopeptidase domain
MISVELSLAPARFVADVFVAFPIIIDTALKGSLLLALCAVVSRALRWRSASMRHAVWTTGIVGHLALPVFTWFAPPLYWQVLPPPPWLGASQWVAAEPRVIPRDPASLILAVCALVWIAGIAVGLMRLVVSQGMRVRLEAASRIESSDRLQIVANSLSERLGNRRAIAVRHHPGVFIPMMTGLLSSTIFVPDGEEAWPPAQREAFLAHEIEHVRRYDTLTQLTAQLALVLFWFDPMLWIAAGRMRLERELACDNAVLRLGIAPWKYANDLLVLARRWRDAGNRTRSSAAAAIAGNGPLEIEQRLRAILDPTTDRRHPSRAVWVTALIVLSLLELPLGALRPFRWPAQGAVASARVTSGIVPR